MRIGDEVIIKVGHLHQGKEVLPQLVGRRAVIKRIDEKGIVLDGVPKNGYYKESDLELLFN